jgi:hypothetical protein
MSLQELLRNHNANPFHPEIADLIDARMISVYNAAILATVPRDLQLNFRKEAMELNSKELEACINNRFKSNLTLDKYILVMAKDDIVYYALVPLSKLKNVDIHALNGCCLTDEKTPDDLADHVLNLFHRLGIIEDGPDTTITDDLKKYREPIPPFKVDDILSISL